MCVNMKHKSVNNDKFDSSLHQQCQNKIPIACTRCNNPNCDAEVFTTMVNILYTNKKTKQKNDYYYDIQRVNDF